MPGEFPATVPGTAMLDRKPIPPIPRLLPGSFNLRSANAKKQQRLMLAALILLLIALLSVLYQDRDFWFPDEQQVLEQSDPKPQITTAAVSPVAQASSRRNPTISRTRKPHHSRIPEAQPVQEEGPSITAVRTPLPPLEVEVIAGDSHRTLRPGINSVQVDLQKASPSKAEVESAEPESGNMIKAADRVEVSPDTAELVTHSVTPGYPMLARQMKVQGSVILEAVIGRDGLIQDLQVVSGPPILARAAQEAVRQWHFKPHYEGSDPVETQAKITVNFTISAN